MINRRFEDIDKAEVDALVERKEAENRGLDYKSQLPADLREFLSDVTSFANAVGGDLIFGIKDQVDSDGRSSGIPAAAVGLGPINEEAAILRLENACRDGIAPRIMGIRMKAIRGSPNGPIIVVRVPRSLNAPHMVAAAGRFWSRNSSGKYPLDVTELRFAFLASEAQADRIRRFREERLARIVADDMPAQIRDKARLILHIVPLSGLGSLESPDIHLAEPQELPMLDRSGWNKRVNFDGVLIYNEPRSYTQLYRNGAIETVRGIDSADQNGNRFIPTGAVEDLLTEALAAYGRLATRIQVEPPWVVLVSLLNVRGVRLGLDSRLGMNLDPIPIDRDSLVFPDLLGQEGRSEEEVLTPVFNMLWQAAGVRTSYRPSEDGRSWIPRT